MNKPLNESLDVNFQRHFIAYLLADTELLMLVRPFINAEQFTDEIVKGILRATLDFYDKYHTAPDESIIGHVQNMASKSHTPSSIYQRVIEDCKVLLEAKLQNRDYLLDQYDHILRSMAFGPAMLRASELGKQGDFDGALHALHTAMQATPRGKANLGTSYTTDPSARSIRRSQAEAEIFYTLIPKFDEHRLFVRRGEVAIIQGQKTGIGKSSLIVFLAKNLAYQKKRVVIYSMEMSEHDYEDRLDMAVSGMPSKDMDESPRLREELHRIIRYDDMIHIKQFPSGSTTIEHLKQHAKMLRDTKGFCPDVVMVDYDSLLDSGIPGLRKDIHQTGHQIYSQLRGWMVEEQMGCWIASQSVKQAGANEKADVGDMGGSAAKAQIADMVISINRNEQEAVQGETRIFAAKVRNAPSGFQFSIPTNLTTMQFWDSSREFNRQPDRLGVPAAAQLGEDYDN